MQKGAKWVHQLVAPVSGLEGADGCFRVGIRCSFTVCTQEAPSVHPSWVPTWTDGSGWVRQGGSSMQIGESAISRVLAATT